MLPKSQRLTKENDFKKIFNQGKKIASRFFVLYFLKNSLTSPRVAIVVSNKVSKKAVIRNKLKRRMREIVKKASLKGLDVVISAKPSALDKNFQELKEDLSLSLTKIC